MIRLKSHPRIKKLTQSKKKNKYGAIKCKLDGLSFDSKMERDRYVFLRDRLGNDEIEELQIHPAYTIYVNNIKIGKVILDFKYYDKEKDTIIIEDVKGKDNALSKWKRKHLEAEYCIKVRLVLKEDLNTK